MLGYNVIFPLSLVLNKKVITKYQMLFRHLLICKYLERSLSNTWLKGTRKTSNVDENYRPSYIMCSLHGKMLHFIHQMTYYMFFEVIEPQWNIMETSIIKALTVSDLLSHHDNFLNSCLKECMLTNQKLIAVNLCIITTGF
jgi:gamma-tubulin complex component 2